MNVALYINNSTSPRVRFVSWVPSPYRLHVTNPSDTFLPIVSVMITGVLAAGGGAVVFRKNTTSAFPYSLDNELYRGLG